MVEYLDDLEINVCRRVNALSRVAAIRRFFSAVSKLGDYPAWVIFGLIVAVRQGAAAPQFAVHALVTAGIPVMAHVGLRPQAVHTMGGYKIQRDREQLIVDATAAQDAGATVKHIDIRREDCTLDMDDFRAKLSERTRLVAVGNASNAVGTINPVKKITQIAHDVGALVYVDAVQYAPHGPIDVQDLGCDFLVCSAYKYFGPHVGVLYGRYQLLDELTAQRGLQYHELRHRNSGVRVWVDLHLLFPAETPIEDAHRQATEIEAAIKNGLDVPAAVTSHLEAIEGHESVHREIKNTAE